MPFEEAKGVQEETFVVKETEIIHTSCNFHVVGAITNVVHVEGEDSLQNITANLLTLPKESEKVVII